MSEAIPSPDIPTRKRPVHLPIVDRGNRALIIFLTVCTKNRARVLASAQGHRHLIDAWQKAGHWLVGRYVIMPDHVHLFCAPARYPATPLSNWIRFWKTTASKRLGYREGELWQRDHWDTQLRAGESYAAKWHYVRQNPLRAGLVVDPDDWPYQGVVHELRWHA